MLLVNLKINLKKKSKIRDNELLFGINKNCNLGSPDSGRNPKSVLIIGWRQGLFYEKKKGGDYMNRRKTFLLVPIIFFNYTSSEYAFVAIGKSVIQSINNIKAFLLVLDYHFSFLYLFHFGKTTY